MPTLGDVASVSAGHPFRGAIRASEEGEAHVLQVADLDLAKKVDWNALTRTVLPGRREPDWLKPGDIVFLPRGRRNIAVYLDEVPVPTVASQHLFIIRVQSELLSPAFLAWQLNQPPAQEQFDAIATGTYQRAIPASGLKQLHVAIPPLEQQQLLVALHERQLRERALYDALIENRERELQAIARRLLAV